ncbi:15497_t:CDS:2, partial [Acaulospora colombiana]
TSALLKDCNFPTEDFTDNVLKCLPPIPWTIPDREFEIRKDLRDRRIFSIDPPTARDIDDALSITKNDDGTYEVGVHIADVSYFVKPNTALDRDARKRSTSVYLVQRAVPMLPPALSEQLCSLLAGEERLAFSVIFTLTEDARFLTVFRSAAKLSYPDALGVIEGQALPEVPIYGSHDTGAISSDIVLLHKLAKHLRQRRFQNGTLRVKNNKLMFELDDNGIPTDCYNYEYNEANLLVEEFMLLTNFAVAQQIAVALPEQALLRRHDEPLERRLRAGRLGYEMDISTAGALQRSFDTITSPDARRQLEGLAIKAMHRAKYFCAGMLDIAKYQHYALNAPLYTHFTSPIRRYADVLVHRQLDAVLSPIEGETKFSMDRDSVAKVAQHCNMYVHSILVP